MIIIMMKERGQFLVDTLGSNCEILEYDDDKFIKLKIIKIDHHVIYDAFYAGLKYGINFERTSTIK